MMQWVICCNRLSINCNWCNRWVVYPWNVPIIDELGMTSFLTLGLVDTKEDPTVELIKKELAGETSIKRVVRQGQPNVEAFHDQPQTAIDMCASSSVFLVELFVMVAVILVLLPVVIMMCKDNKDKLLEKLEAIAEAVEKLKSRRDIIPSNEVRDPCTPTVAVRRKRRKIRQILSILKSTKIATPPALKVVKVQGPPKKVDIFAELGKEKEEELQEIMNGKMKIQKEYTIHSFAAEYFMNMTNMCEWYEDNYVDEILCLMRGRQLAYLDAYYTAARIMDLNFYNNFKDRYDDLRKDVGTGGQRFDELVSTFQWDDEEIKYVRRKRPYPHGKSWTKAKKILAIMNVEVKHFLGV
ncbi:hypothetical protein P3S67_029055 [Capsicum chacoense]